MTFEINEQLAQVTAEYMVENLFTDAYGKVSFPIDPVALATHMGYAVRTAKFPVEDRRSPILGVVTKKSGQRTITLERSSKEQQRFVTAALLAGEFIHEEGEEYGYILHSRPIRNDEMEYLVDCAMNLLMPAFAVRNLWGEGRSVRNLARVFGVPMEIMETRLTNLFLY